MAGAGVSGIGGLGLDLSGPLSLDALTVIADAIQQQEGYYPGSLAYENNNPGNLIFVGQQGAVLGASGFAKFPSYEAGRDALLRQLQLYAKRGLTIQEMMDIYAPAGHGGNNPVLYAVNIANSLGVPVTTKLNEIGSNQIDYSGQEYPPSANPSSPGFEMGTGMMIAAGVVGGLLLLRSS